MRCSVSKGKLKDNVLECVLEFYSEILRFFCKIVLLAYFPINLISMTETTFQSKINSNANELWLNKFEMEFHLEQIFDFNLSNIIHNVFVVVQTQLIIDRSKTTIRCS